MSVITHYQLKATFPQASIIIGIATSDTQHNSHANVIMKATGNRAEGKRNTETHGRLLIVMMTLR